MHYKQEFKIKVFESLSPQDQLDLIAYAIQGSALICMFHVSIYGKDELVKAAVAEWKGHVNIKEYIDGMFERWWEETDEDLEKPCPTCYLKVIGAQL